MLLVLASMSSLKNIDFKIVSFISMGFYALISSKYRYVNQSIIGTFQNSKFRLFKN